MVRIWQAGEKREALYSGLLSETEYIRISRKQLEDGIDYLNKLSICGGSTFFRPPKRDYYVWVPEINEFV